MAFLAHLTTLIADQHFFLNIKIIGCVLKTNLKMNIIYGYVHDNFKDILSLVCLGFLLYPLSEKCS